MKCDERPNGCANCERLHLECPGYHRPGPTSSTADEPPARGRRDRRTGQSCSGCRIAKSKCSGERPVCERCRDNSLQCSYQDSAEERAATFDRSSMSNNGSEAGYPTPNTSNLQPSAPDLTSAAGLESRLLWYIDVFLL